MKLDDELKIYNDPLANFLIKNMMFELGYLKFCE